MRKFFFLVVSFFLLLPCVNAQGKRAVDISTDVTMFLPSVVGGVRSLVEGDYEGIVQHFKSGALTVATTYLLKYTINKSRPDGSDNHSFPSNHAGVAFVGASFLQQRYGWKWGAPAYAVAAYVGWGRIYSKKHDVWDVLTGAAIGVGSGILFTSPYAKKHSMAVAPFALPDGGCGVHFSMTL